MTLELTLGTSLVAPAPRRDIVRLRFVTSADEWERLVATAPSPHLTQSYAFGEGKSAKGWVVRRAVFEFNGRPVAFSTILELRRMGVRLLSRVNRGPIFIDQNPAERVVVDVYRELRRRFGRFWHGLLLIAPPLPHGEASNNILRRAGFALRHQHSWTSGRIDLTRDESEIWQSLAPTFRNRVRSAARSGATLEVSACECAYEWLLDRHIENMAEKNFKAADPEMLRALRQADPNRVLVFRMVVEGQPVAGMSIVSFGTHCEYHIGWFGPEGRARNAGNFLMWAIIKEMKRRGLKSFDVGGLKPGDGYTRFKRTMRPVEYQLAGEWFSF